MRTRTFSQRFPRESQRRRGLLVCDTRKRVEKLLEAIPCCEIVDEIPLRVANDLP